MNISAKHVLTVTLGLGLGTLGLAACTSPSTPTSTPTSPSASQGGTDQQERERWEADLASCLAGQGFDLPDEPGQIDFGSRQGEYALASRQCQDEVGPPPGARENITPEERAALEESRAAINTCFRDAGFEEGVGDDPELYVEPEGVSEALSEKCFAAGDDALENGLGR